MYGHMDISISFFKLLQWKVPSSKLDQSIFLFFLSHFIQAAKTAQNSNAFGKNIDDVEPLLY